MANDTQIKELANTIALQAEAIALQDGAIDQRWTSVQVALLLSNVRTLRAWVPVND